MLWEAWREAGIPSEPDHPVGHRAGDPKARESPSGTIPTHGRDQGPPKGVKVLPIPAGTALSGA